MTTALLQTKLFRPADRPDLVPRRRLVEALDVCLAPHGKLALVSAPAGSGKTTLAAAWLRALEERNASILPPCWLSLDPGDNDLARFLTYLAAALGTAAAGLGESALGLLRGQAALPFESFLTVLINDITALLQDEAAGGDERLLILILDDYHLVEAEPVHQAVAFLLEHLPQRMRLAILSRTDPPLPVARLRGRGQLLALGADDLRFTDEEARLFLNRLTGLALSSEELATLTARTEGWAAGLQMAALALTTQRVDGSRDGRRPAESRTGRRFIMDYFLEEVLDGQPEPLHSYLLETAVLDRLTASLAEAVTGQANGKTVLSELERRNLFLVPLDGEGTWYRFHHLFAELLRHRLALTRPEALPTLHRRAAAWYAANDYPAEAIRHSLAAGDHDEAARLVESSCETAIMQSEFVTVQRWLGALPEDVLRARPRLGVYRAFLMLLDSQPAAKIEAVLQAAEERLTRERVAAQGDSEEIVGEAMLVRAAVALLAGELDKSLDLAQRATPLLSPDARFMRSLALRILGSVYSMNGDARAAAATLAQAVELAERTADTVGLVVALQALARVQLLQGRLRAAEQTLARALSVAEDSHGRPLPIAARVFMALAEVKRKRNDLAEAARLAQDSIRLSEQGVASWIMSTHITLARVRLAQRELTAAQASLDTARELAIRLDVTDLDDRVVELEQALLWLSVGDLSAAAQWASRELAEEVASVARPFRPEQMAGWYLVREMEQLFLARLHLAQGQPGKALALLPAVLTEAREKGRIDTVIEVLTLLALARSAAGQETAARRVLEEALALAAPEGYMRIFLEAGEGMAALLERLPADGPHAGYVGLLLAAFPPSEPTTSQPTADPLDAADLLSERELDVLRLLPTFLNSSEMAAELTISPNTVRFHIKNIYGKLDVHSRAAAVDRARELRLL